MDAQITLKVSEVLTIIGSIAVPLAAALALIWKRGEAKNKVIVELTKSFVEVTKDVKTAMENNTKVIEKLPEQFVLQMRANGK